MIIKICEFCGEEFSSQPSQKRRFCSIECRNHIWKGTTHPFYGKHHTEKSKQLNREKHLGKNSGENHYNYTGKNRRYWQHQALLRDDFTCQICGFRDEEIMIVDHIKPQSIHPELKFRLDNLQTLCPNCDRRKTNKELRNKEYYKE